MNPIIKQFWTPEERARYGIRGIDDFTAEELARLQQKVEGWICQRPPQTGRPRRYPSFVRKPRASESA
jgi:hypothetical protein